LFFTAPPHERLACEFAGHIAGVERQGKSSSTERWNDVPRGTMDEVSSYDL
jgi:hypothetical protein